jgi:hypothetical protein
MYWIGLILCIVGGLWIVVNAFRTSIWWGLGSLIIPLVALIYAIMNFAENKIPLAIYVVGVVVLVASGAFSGQVPATPAF